MPVALPKQYAWLNTVNPPKMIVEALKLYGVHEGAGSADNQTLLDWAKEVGLTKTYSHDSIPWCGLFMALVATRAGHAPIPDGPLWALNWGHFGQPGGQPELGDVLVFVRPGGGHVGLYVGEDSTAYHVLGGNSSDQVKIIRIDKHRLHACRQPTYNVKPASAKPYILAPTGRMSNDQA
jgi:uncharacterized protein (TIGR02594 family)